MKPLLFIALLFVVTFQQEIHCKIGQPREYEAVSNIHQSTGLMRVKIRFIVTCLGEKRISNKIQRTNQLDFVHAELSESGKPVQPINEFRQRVFFTQNANGRITTFLHTNTEKPWVSAMKKSIVRAFQTKLRGLQRKEETQIGDVLFKYERGLGPHGSTMIRKVSSEVVKSVNPSVRLNQIKYNYQGVMKINNDNVIIDITMSENIMIGVNSERREEIYQNEKKATFKQNPDMNQGGKESFSTRTETTIVFIGIPIGRTNTLSEEDAEALETPGLHLKHTDLGLDDSVVQEVKLNQMKKMEKNTNILALLSKLRMDSDDLNTLTEVHSYTRLLSHKAISAASQEFKKLDLENPRDVEYTKVLQSIFSVAGTPEAQQELIKTMNHKNTLQSGILNFVVIDKPTHDSLAHLQSIAKLENNGDIEPETLEMIKTNAYLVSATLSSKVENFGKSQEVVNDILDNMEDSQTLDDYVLHVHALGNAGEAVPVEALELLAKGEHLPLEVQLAAVKALGKRTNDQSHDVLESITLSNQFNEHVRIASVKAMTNRESKVNDGAFVEHAADILSVENHPDMVQSVREYLLENGGERALDILEGKNTLDDEYSGWNDVNNPFGAGFWSRKGPAHKMNEVMKKEVYNPTANAFITAGNFIGHAAVKTGEAVVMIGKETAKGVSYAARKVKDGVIIAYDATIGAVDDLVQKAKDVQSGLKRQFSAAVHEGTQVCRKVDKRAQLEMCVYDTEMSQYMGKQIMTENEAGSYYKFEELFGPGLAHLYLGGIGYYGTKMKKPTDAYQGNAFKRFEAKFRAFGKTFSIGSFEAESSWSSTIQSARRFSSLLDTSIIGTSTPYLVNDCAIKSVPIIDKARISLGRLDFIFIIVVPFTLSIEITASAGVGLNHKFCVREKDFSQALISNVALSLSGSLGIGIPILQAKVTLTLSGGFQYKFDNYGFIEGGILKMRSQIQRSVTPLSITITGSIEVVTFTVGEFEIYKYAAPEVAKKVIFAKETKVQ